MRVILNNAHEAPGSTWCESLILASKARLTTCQAFCGDASAAFLLLLSDSHTHIALTAHGEFIHARITTPRAAGMIYYDSAGAATNYIQRFVLLAFRCAPNYAPVDKFRTTRRRAPVLLEELMRSLSRMSQMKRPTDRLTAACGVYFHSLERGANNNKLIKTLTTCAVVVYFCVRHTMKSASCVCWSGWRERRARSATNGAAVCCAARSVI